jgi:quercetin dioxygenase-like cupin family protein
MTKQPSEVGTTRGVEEREARSMSAPLLRFDLSAEAARLRDEREYAEGDRNARTLAKVDWFRLTLVALRSGATLREADQRGSVALQVLHGRVVVRIGKETAEIAEAEVAVVAPGHPWEAVAEADSLILVHLAWPPEPGSVTT